MLRAYGLSETGPFRKANEDCFASDEELHLFVVADGMGGHAAGEVASRLAVEAVVGFVRRSQEDSEFSWPYGIDSSLSYNANRLRTAIHLANRRVFRTAESHDDYVGMGTTVVCALVAGNHLAIGNVGDSRLYLLNGQGLQQLTHDDSWAATLLAQDHGTEPGMLARHPMRNVLTNVVGARDQTEIHLSERTLDGGETILLCTDGIHSVLADETMQQLIDGREDLEALARGLIQSALDRGSRDNLTALLIRYEAD
ncbi:MAG: serine/threonine-protein phosphatase [Acidobacteria bacterium]|nr:serine/threonine-protein phosphatase [Acidobacteriota bacterium]